MVDLAGRSIRGEIPTLYCRATAWIGWFTSGSMEGRLGFGIAVNVEYELKSLPAKK